MHIFLLLCVLNYLLMLYLVPTPIGNLQDITLRAIETLKNADLILCEDTRTSGVLLKHLGISKPLKSYHAFNEHQIIGLLVPQLKQGLKMALISDAGTPGIADPGFLLARACLREQIAVECLPGPTALIPALLKSGLAADRFVFEGFLPVKKGRKTRFESLQKEPRTIIFYESPHRIGKTLQELVTYMGAERYCSVSRELTKLYEETRNGTLGELALYYANKTVKGEIVVVLEGFSE
ncbi:MAG: 16S rRNA (cytidine(1402)-2'-O)-methyltransferase [Cytophagales bacterium]|nr:MAG: 16S rRNA (cytidine(1402)-2'-O)-methyltransferase [Cytophagales bacterium]TAF60331.1 MAG: 16S rRNA (cytidine(1402)-2'-O)-methyltransferase [Cytophagales bacterium]